MSHIKEVQISVVAQKFIKSIFSERKMNEVQPTRPGKTRLFAEPWVPGAEPLVPGAEPLVPGAEPGPWIQPQVGALGDMGNLVNLKVQSGVDSFSKQVDLEEKENIEQPIRKKKTRGKRGGKKLREKRELRELRERNRKLGKVRISTNF